MAMVIFHNPACGTSRNVVQIAQAAGEDPTVIEYLTEGWTRPQLLALFAAADITPREALRTLKSPAEELGTFRPERSGPSPAGSHAGTSRSREPADCLLAKGGAPVSPLRGSV